MAKKKSDAGKGDTPRKNENLEVFRKRHDRINWTKDAEYEAWLNKFDKSNDAESE